MDRVALSVTKNAFLPASAEAEALLGRLKIGEKVQAEIFRQRSVTFSSCVQLVFERIAKTQHQSMRNIRGVLAATSGRADVVTLGGKRAVVPWSTSPREMNAEQFETFWEDVREIIIADILPTLSQPEADAITDLINNADRHMGGDHEPASASSSESSPASSADASHPKGESDARENAQSVHGSNAR